MAYADTIRTTTFTASDIASLIDGLLPIIQNQSYTYGGTSSGSANAQTISLTLAPASYTAGLGVSFIAGFTSTSTTPTLNVNSLGAITMKRLDGSALQFGDIVAGGSYYAFYNGTNFLVENNTTTTSLDTGWFPVNESWTYASATTITVPTDATLRFQVGDKLRCTNSTTKYFYIVGVAATTITITGGSDYTLTNVAISAIYVSRAVSPFGFPGAFNWSPTLVGFSANPTTTMYEFACNGKECTVRVRQVTSGTSNATTFTISAPITAATVTNGIWGEAGLTVYNNGTRAYTGNAYINSAASVITIELDSAGTAWTNVNGKSVNYFNFTYRIA